MELEKLIMDNIHGIDERQMHCITKAISCFVEEHCPEDKHKLYKSVYGIISDGHYDREYSLQDIEAMYYDDQNGIRHHAPFFTEDEVRNVFSRHQVEIPDYTIYDLAVTMNMVRSDNHQLLYRYAKDDAELKEMVECMSIGYLTDPDAPNPRNKIWKYING